MTSASDKKWRLFNCFFQSREHLVVRRGQIRRIVWVINTLVVQVGQFLLGCKCPMSRGIVVQEQDSLGEIPASFLLQNVLQLHQQRWVILRVESLVLWKIINEEDAFLIPKYRGENFSSGFLHLEFLRAGWAAMPPTPLIVVLSPGHSDITRFHPLSPIAPDRKSFESRRKNSKSCSDDWHSWRFWSAFRHFGTHFAKSFCMSRSSWIMDPTRSREMPSYSAIDLAEMRRSSKIISWIWLITSGVVTVLGRPGRCSTPVVKTPRLNWATHFLTLA